MKNYNLWPYNPESEYIDTNYYRSLPHVPIDESMKSEVYMYPLLVPVTWTPHKQEVDGKMIVHLVSEKLSSPEEAEHFARAIEKHNCGIVRVAEDTVYADFHIYSIRANWRENLRAFEFANWA